MPRELVMARGWSDKVHQRQSGVNHVKCLLSTSKIEVFRSNHAILIMVGFAVLIDYLDPGQSKRS